MNSDGLTLKRCLDLGSKTKVEVDNGRQHPGRPKDKSGIDNIFVSFITVSELY